MVFTLRGPPSFEIISGVTSTGKFIGFLAIQISVAIVTAFFNIVAIGVLIRGRKTLMKNHFYIIVFNLLACTSIKNFVEIGFNIPYSIFSDYLPWGRFPMEYEMFIFYTSIFADYGVLFFSMALAVNRYVSLTRSAEAREPPRWITVLSCVLSWKGSIDAAVLFFLCQCQYNYSTTERMYYHRCFIDTELIQIALGCLIYLPYACVIVMLTLYSGAISSSRLLSQYEIERSNAEMSLLRQSLVIFIVYAASMIALFVLSFIDPGDQFFDIIYIENLLNLSIAAVYPICMLLMPGEMRSMITTKRSQGKIGSLTANNKLS